MKPSVGVEPVSAQTRRPWKPDWLSAPERSSVSEDNISKTEGNRFLPDAPVPLGDVKIASVQTIQTLLISSEEF